MPKNPKDIVNLTDGERTMLEDITRKGTCAARKLKRAPILLKAAARWKDEALMEALDVSASRVDDIRKRCVEEGPEAALKDRPRPGQRRKRDGRPAAHQIAVACSEPPQGHDPWTLRLRAGQVGELGFAESCRYATVRQLLKNTLKPWQVQEGCTPEVSAEYVAAMEEVPDLYEAPYDPARPVVCFDESPRQWICGSASVRAPGKPAREDTEYERTGVRDRMMICEPRRGEPKSTLPRACATSHVSGSFTTPPNMGVGSTSPKSSGPCSRMPACLGACRTKRPCVKKCMPTCESETKRPSRSMGASPPRIPEVRWLDYSIPLEND